MGLSSWQFVEKRSEDVILRPFALRLRTALSGAKGLRINSAKDLLFVESSPCEILRRPSAPLRAGSAAPRNDTGHEFINVLLEPGALRDNFAPDSVAFLKGQRVAGATNQPSRPARVRLDSQFVIGAGARLEIAV